MITGASLRDGWRGLFSGKSFASHVAVVSGSALAAQVLGVLVGPINSRLYRPADYGTLSLFAAMFTSVAVVGTLQYEMSLATADDDPEAMHLMVLCFLLIAGCTTLVALAAFGAPFLVTRLLSRDNPQFYRHLWFLPFGICATALFQTLQRWAMRRQAFPRLSLVLVLQSLLASGCTVALGFAHAGLAGLIAGSVVGSLFGVAALGRLAWPQLRALAPRLSLAGLRAAARRYYRYPLYTTWSTLMSTLSGLVPVLLLTRGFGPTYTGYFSLCQRILFLPIILVSGAITPVFYSRAKQAQRDGSLTRLTTRLIDSISGINVFFAVFLGLFGEWLFVLVFGPQWQRAGQYAAALAPWVLCNFLVNPLEALPLVFDRQRTSFVFQALLLALRTAALAVGIRFHSDLLAMWLYGGASAAFMLVYFAWLLLLVHGPVSRTLARLGKELALSLAAFGACRWLLEASHHDFLITAAALVPVLAFFALRGTRQLLLGRAPDMPVERPPARFAHSPSPQHPHSMPGRSPDMESKNAT
ncbi:MAG: lipopolysaccharide biosynthesis protein [Holophaga sp.]|jgi:O-antigen/teichoic acid export membrane protein